MPGLRLDAFTLAAVVDDLSQSVPAAYADAIEFRMDFASDPIDQLETYDGSLPLIATNRAEWEGGAAADDDRIEQLQIAAATPAVAAIDIELASVDEPAATPLRSTAADHGTDVIVSSHDFESTPERAELASRLRRACEWGDVGKLAVTAQAVDDVLDVLDVTRALTRSGASVATMCMGEVGRHSRVIAPLYGSRIGYAPVDPADATAPGQYSLADMAELIDALA